MPSFAELFRPCAALPPEVSVRFFSFLALAVLGSYTPNLSQAGA